MKRMTRRLDDGGARRNCDGCERQMVCGPYDCLQRMVNRLASYEDTGLSPKEIEDLASVREIPPEVEFAITKHADRIIERLDKLLKKTDDDARTRELAEADSEDRVIVLPSCKIGDTLYYIENGRIYPRVITTVNFCLSSTLRTIVICTKNYRGETTGILASKLGKTAFLSLEEAEQALGEMEGKKDG